MRKWREKRKNRHEYTMKDYIIEALLWIPEIILLPFRLVWWMIRGIGRFIAHFFDNI